MYTKQVFVDDSGALWSLTANPLIGRLHDDWVVEYRPGEWVKARQEGTLLFVDEVGKEDEYPNLDILCTETWECKVLGVSRQWRMLVSSYAFSDVMLRDFWNRHGRGVKHPQVGGICYTTRLVKEVKLTRRIHGND